MNIFRDKLRIINNKVYYDFELKENNKKTLTLGVFNNDIDSILKKYITGLRKLKIRTKIYKSNKYISIYQQKNYLFNNFKDININYSINEEVLFILNSYFNLMNKALLFKQPKINDNKELFDYLNNVRVDIDNQIGNKSVNVQNNIFLSEEDNIFYPSYYIQLPITEYKVLKFFIIRHEKSYIYGCTYYFKGVRSRAFNNINDMVKYLISILFDLIYYKLPEHTDIEMFLDNAAVHKEFYKMIKY